MFKSYKYDDNAKTVQKVIAYPDNSAKGMFLRATGNVPAYHHLSLAEWKEMVNPSRQNIWGNR